MYQRLHHLLDRWQVGRNLYPHFLRHRQFDILDSKTQELLQFVNDLVCLEYATYILCLLLRCAFQIHKQPEQAVQIQFGVAAAGWLCLNPQGNSP